MKRILFVTTRNILTSCGELRLIKNRAESLFHIYGIPTDFIELQKAERIYSENKESIDAGGTLEFFQTSFTNPVLSMKSYSAALKLIQQKLDTQLYSTLVFSGYGFNSWCKKIKRKYDVKIIFDIHGANEDMIETARNSRFIKKLSLSLMYWHQSFCSKNQYRYADGAFVVTNALIEYTKERYKLSKDFKFFIIPCATTSVKCFDKSTYLRERAYFRRKYGIKDDEIVFIYSGGVSNWQCINETISLYAKIKENTKIKTRFAIFSAQIDVIKPLLGEVDAIIDRHTPDILEKALCMGDFALMLRKKTLTNKVAFPNKYLEYVQSGMTIITTPNVAEIAKQVESFELGYSKYNFECQSVDLYGFIEKQTKVRSYNEELINSVLTYNGFENTEKDFVKFCM